MVRLEDLKQQYPEPPEFIHQMILNEVEKQIKSNTENHGQTAGIRRKRKHPWTIRRTVAAVLAACMIIGTAAFAAVSMYHLKIEEKGKYSVETRVTHDVDEEKSISLPEKIADVRLEADYIPKGMCWRDESHLDFEESPGSGGITFSTLLLDEESDGLNITDTNVVEKEKQEFGEHEGIYMRYNMDSGFSQRIYLLYPELYRILILYISEEVSQEDAYKVASGITLQETGEMLDTSEVWSWSEYISQQNPVGDSDEIMTAVLKKDLKLHKVGNAFPLDMAGEDLNGNHVWASELGMEITAKVDSVEVLDDLSLLEAEYIPDEWKDAVGENGKLMKNQLSYIKKGDGVNTLDEVVGTEEVSQKLVLVTTTYTNNGDQELHNVLYQGNLLLLKEQGSEYRIYTYSDTEGLCDIAGGGTCGESGQAYDDIMQSGVAWSQKYRSPHADYGNGGNYISALKPGESVQTRHAWIVNEPDLEDMYLNVCVTGGMMEFDEDMIETGLVDVRQ